MLRTKTCGELRAGDVDETVTLCGWVESYRDHGEHLVFVDLRDRYGKTQVVFRTDNEGGSHSEARSLRREDVIRITGQVVHRGEGLVNPKLPTGEIEVRVRELEVLNKSQTPPFEPNATELPNEELRLQYRFIDLRRNKLQRAMEIRHRVTMLTREYFDSHNFLEIETPILGRSTPEGARDYLVPSRVHEGAFYALPQSPQLFKQILMVAGYDRYFQIARCFRDEDLRADRQPEFTQIDLEMAFVDRDDIFAEVDGLIAYLMKGIRGEEISLASAPLQSSRRDGALRQRQAGLAVWDGVGGHRRDCGGLRFRRVQKHDRRRRPGAGPQCQSRRRQVQPENHR